MKTALVTGGARGLGLAIARKLKKSGYNVVIDYFSSEAAAKSLREEGFFVVRADVSVSSEVDALFDAAEQKFGRVDVLVNNAGIALRQKLLVDVSEEEFDRLFAVDVKGVFLCSKKAVESMLSTGGQIVNICSIWGIEGASCEVVYSSAKGAVFLFTKALAKELSRSDICVQAIAPSLVVTDMNGHLTKTDVEDFLTDRGVDRPLTPEEFAEITFSLINSAKNGAVTVVESADKIYEI